MNATRPSLSDELKALITRTEQYVCDKMMINTAEEARGSNLSQPWIDQAETRLGFIKDLVCFVETGERGPHLFPDQEDWYSQLDRVHEGESFFTKAVIRLMVEGFFRVDERMDRVRDLLLNV